VVDGQRLRSLSRQHVNQVEYVYDANSNVTQTTSRARFHDQMTAWGALGTPTTPVPARVSYAGAYYDALDRVVASVDVGTNGGSAWTRPSSIPNSSATALVSTIAYNDAGLPWQTTDARGVQSRVTYDALGRTTQSIAAYVDGTPSNNDDATTQYTYANGHTTSVKVLLPGGGVQETGYVYGVSQTTGSGIDSNDIAQAVRYPDPTTGIASANEQDVTTINALGEARTFTDRNGTTHTYSRDILSRTIADAITTLGAGVDGAVRRLQTAYDPQGQAMQLESYDAATGGNVVNQVYRLYNGFGQLTQEVQEHDGTFGAATPNFFYQYTEGLSGNHSRLTGMTYGDGYQLNYTYAPPVDDGLSRLSGISDATGSLTSYSYLGLGAIVQELRPQNGTALSYIKQPGESDGDAGDQYTGLDRFGRVVDQRWINTSTSADTDRYQYGYDQGSRRTYRENLVENTFSELYAYDELGQLNNFQRGTLNSTKDAISGTPSGTRSWAHEATGNWQRNETVTGTEYRTHNRQNEITSVGEQSLSYDANGNLTLDQDGHTLTFDGWNRLVRVANVNDGWVETYEYDALGRRIEETVGNSTRDLYYTGWQVIEERVNDVTQVRYVRGPGYIDSFVLRDRDTNGDGTLDERLYVQQDANFNVTALVDVSGNVVERYANDPFGVRSVYDAIWSAVSGSAVAWVYGHQGLRHNLVVGLIENRMRVYDPELGRFVQMDLIGFAAGDVNWYRAIGNGPTNGVDPSGQAIFIPLFWLGAAYLGKSAVQTAVETTVEAGVARLTGDDKFSWTDSARRNMTVNVATGWVPGYVETRMVAKAVKTGIPVTGRLVKTCGADFAARTTADLGYAGLIEGKDLQQEAIPIVLGNGVSTAGAEYLKAVVRRVRKADHIFAGHGEMLEDTFILGDGLVLRLHLEGKLGIHKSPDEAIQKGQ
jgi:RHS repeat-associated protein